MAIAMTLILPPDAAAPGAMDPALHDVTAAAGPRVTARAFARLAAIQAQSGSAQALRIAVEGGGCSGFQYDIRLDAAQPDDLVLRPEGAGEAVQVLIDPVSLPFLDNAVIDFTDELIGARFTIENPNATSSCGCGTSFSL